jgi:hypothetical protein
MEDWKRLDMERVELERQLVMAEQEIGDLQRGAQPDRDRLRSMSQHIDGCLKRLGTINEELSRIRRPQM